jgi:hypothetical protein
MRLILYSDEKACMIENGEIVREYLPQQKKHPRAIARQFSKGKSYRRQFKELGAATIMLRVLAVKPDEIAPDLTPTALPFAPLPVPETQKPEPEQQVKREVKSKVRKVVRASEVLPLLLNGVTIDELKAVTGWKIVHGSVSKIARMGEWTVEWQPNFVKFHPKAEIVKPKATEPEPERIRSVPVARRNPRMEFAEQKKTVSEAESIFKKPEPKNPAYEEDTIWGWVRRGDKFADIKKMLGWQNCFIKLSAMAEKRGWTLVRHSDDRLELVEQPKTPPEGPKPDKPEPKTFHSFTEAASALREVVTVNPDKSSHLGYHDLMKVEKHKKKAEKRLAKQPESGHSNVIPMPEIEARRENVQRVERKSERWRYKNR